MDYRLLLDVPFKPEYGDCCAAIVELSDSRAVALLSVRNGIMNHALPPIDPECRHWWFKWFDYSVTPLRSSDTLEEIHDDFGDYFIDCPADIHEPQYDGDDDAQFRVGTSLISLAEDGVSWHFSEKHVEGEAKFETAVLPWDVIEAMSRGIPIIEYQAKKKLLEAAGLED